MDRVVDILFSRSLIDTRLFPTKEGSERSSALMAVAPRSSQERAVVEGVVVWALVEVQT
jgi:hypothetical protein